MRPVHYIRRSSSRTLALEPRLLFDGAAMVAAQDAINTDDGDAADPSAAEHELGDLPRSTEASQTVALIDARLPQWAELSQTLEAQGMQVHVVAAGDSGLAAIGDALASAQSVNHLQIHAYHEAGQQLLGQDAVTQDGLQTAATTNSQWQYYLSEGANIELSARAGGSAAHEIVFVSDDTPDWQALVATLPSDTRVVVLDASHDGVEQMAAALAGEHDISAIHIISHGSASELQLGTAQLNAQSMQAQYLNALSTIGQSLTADGDILIYGCDFAQGDAGLQAAMVLGGITGADIAASTDPTGAASLGGDWDLELNTGLIESRTIASAESAATWSHLLALPTDSGETVTIDEDTTLEKTAADGLLANAFDADNDPLTVTGFRVNGVAGVIGSDFIISGVGALLINADGSYRFIPLANYNGSVGLISYEVSDGGFIPTTSLLSITVNPVNDAPVNTIPGTEGNVQWTTPEDTLVNLAGLKVSDIDAGNAQIEVRLTVSSGILGVLGDSGTIGGVTVTGASTDTVTLTGTVANINAYLASAGRLNFNPAANFFGDVKLTMTTTDKGASGAGTALVDTDSRLITVTPRADAPTGTDKTLTLNAGDVHTFTVADFGFSDADDGALANNFKQIIVTWVPAAGTGTLTLNGVAVKVNDVITVAQIPNLKYTASGSGLFVAMGFKVVDDGSTASGGQNTDLTPNKIRVHIPGDDVGAIADSSTTNEDVATSGYVLTNDIAGNGGTLSVKSFTVAGQTYTPSSTGTSVTITDVGVFTMKSNGAWTFTPEANYAGAVPQITYIAAETVDINMLDTGRTYGDAGLPANSVDPNYVLISGPAGATQPILKNHPWFGWNSISSDNNQALKGTYVYETSFYIPSDVDLSTLAMSLIGGADDYGAIKIYVNGVELVSTGVAPGSSQYYYNISSTSPAGAKPLQHETNVMRIVIENTQSQQALLVKDWKLSYQTFDTSTLDISITPVNDAPAGTDRTETINQNGSYTFSAAAFGFSDPKDNPSNAFQSVIITTLPAAAHGQLLLNGVAVTTGQEIAISDLGLLVYQSKTGLTGNSLGAFTFQVKDNGGTANGGVDTDQSPNTFKFNIIPLPPVYDGDEAETKYEDTVVSGNLLNNSSTSAPPVIVLDFTVEGTKYTVLPFTGATANITGVGSLQILADGSYTFTPVSHWNGKVPLITYTVRNLVSSTDTSTLDITLLPVNDAPAGTDHTETLAEDSSYTFSAAAFGFSDPRDNPANAFMSVIITTLPPAADGVLLFNGAAINAGHEIPVGQLGLLVFKPTSNLNGNGVGAFTFQVKDDGGTVHGGVDTDQSPNRFDFNITPVTDGFTDGDESVSTPEDTPISGNLLAGTASVDGPVSIISFRVDGTSYAAGDTATLAGIGTLLINTDGNYTFTPALHWNGTVPTVTYTVTDTISSDTSTLKIVVTPVTNGFTDGDEVVSIPQNTSITANVLTGSSSVDGPLSILDFTVNGTGPILPGQTANIAGIGTLIIQADGTYTFTPATGWFGTVPQVSYTVSDTVSTDTSTLDITVTKVIDADEIVSTLEDTPISGDVLTGTTSVNGPVSVQSFNIEGVNYAAGTTATLTGIGELEINADGSYTFTPAANWHGKVPQVIYIVSDTKTTDISTLDITVTPVTDGFADGNEVISTPEDTPISGSVLAGTSSVDGPVSVVDFTINGNTYAAGSTATITGVGTLVLRSNGTYTFTPAANWHGTVPQVSYTVSDAVSTDASTLDITVTPITDGFADGNEVVSTPEDTPISGTVLGGTSSVDGPISVMDFTINGNTYTAGSTATIAGVGTLVLRSNGTYTFTPAANWHGTVPQVSYTVSDTVSTDTSTLDITVTPVTDGFTDGNEAVSTPEDTPISGTVLGGTSSVDGPVSVTDFTVNGNTYAAGSTVAITGVGTLVLRADGTYTFTPAANWHGTVPQVGYTVSDTVSTDTSTLDITVTPVTDGFTDGDESVSTPEDTPISGSVLGGTSSVDGPVSVVDFTINGNTYAAGSTATIAGVGTLILRADGTYTFTPATNWHGTVPQVTYTVNDTVSTDTSTLDITVTPVTDGFTDGNEAVSTPEDTPISGTVLGGTSSVDGPVSVVDFTINGNTYAAGSTATIAGVGTLVLRSNGTYTFTPATNWHGAVPQVTYTVGDTVSTDTSTLDITVTPVTDGFADGNEVVSTPEDTPISGTVLSGTSSVDGPVSIADFTINGNTYAAGSTATIAGIGALVLRSDGSYTFTPAANWHGTVPQVSYTVSDTVSTDTSTLDITVTPVTDGFTDGNEAVSTPEDTPISGTVLDGTFSVDGPVSIADFTINGNTYAAGSTATIAGIGALVLRSDGSYTFTPAANWHGTVPQVSYTVSDTVSTDTSTLDITVTPVTDGFADGNEVVSTPEDTPISGMVLGGTSSVDGPVSVVDFTIDGNTYAAGSTATIASVGTLALKADGTYTFTPAANWHGRVPQVSYTVSDTVSTDTSTLDITVTPVTDGFADGNESVSTPEDTPISGSLLTGTFSVDGPVSVVDFTINGNTYAAGSTATIAGVGTLVLRSNGTYTFTPAANWHGTVPQVSYTVSDTVSTDTSTLDITVTPVTDGFTDGDESVSTPEDMPISGTVLGGTSSVDGPVSVVDFTINGNTYAAGSTVTITGVGTLILRADGTYTFTPAANWHGTVPQVSYTVSDTVSTDTSTLDITVTPVTDGFADGNEVVSTPEDTPISGTVLSGTSSVDGPVSVTDFTINGNTYAAGFTATITGVGTLVLRADSTYTFTPATNWHGTVPQVTYTVSDTVSTDTSTLDITVTPATDGFSDGNESVSTPEDTPISGSVLTGTFSVDGPVSVTDFTINGNTYTAGSTASITGVGTLIINADGSYTFTPLTRWNGRVPQVSYTVSDSISTDHSTLDITVTPVNAGPVADHDAQTVEHGAAATGNVLGNDSDPDGDALSVTGFSVNGQHHGAGSTVTIDGVGQLTIAKNGDYRFVPATGYSGSVPTAGYVISDGELTATANLDLKVKPSEVAPVIQVIIPPSPYLPAEPPPPGWPVVTQSLGIGEWVLKTVQIAQQEQQMQAQVSDPRVLETLQQQFAEPSQALTPQVIQYVIHAVRDSQYQAAILKAQASDSRHASFPSAPAKPRGDSLPDWLIKEIEKQIQSAQDGVEPPEKPVNESKTANDREELVAEWLFAPDSGLQQDMPPPAMAGGWASSLSAQLRANASGLPGQRVLQA